MGEEKDHVQEHTVKHGVRDIIMFQVPLPRGPELPPTVSVRAVGDGDVVWLGWTG